VLTDLRWLGLAGLGTALWLAVLGSDISGEYGYWLPFGVLGMVALVMLLGSAARPGQTALLMLLIVLMTAINYRVRATPENANDGRGLQNTFKVAVWLCLLTPAAINWRIIAVYFRDPRFSVFLVFIALSMASTAWSIEPLMTAVSALGMLIYLMFAALLAEVFSTRTLVVTMVWSLAAYGAANWLYILIDPGTAWLDTGSLTPRLQGMSGHPNFLGIQAAIPLCLLIGTYKRDYFGRVWFYLLCGLSIATLIASQSRTSAISLMLSYAICRWRRPFIAIVLLALVLLTVAMITGTLEQITALFVRQGDGDPLAGRGGIWDYVGTKILAHPWFGYGYNIFERYFEYDNPNVLNPLFNNAQSPPIPSHPHNSYLEVLFSGGIVTLVPYLVWSGLVIRQWYQRPDLLRDLLMLWFVFSSMTEVGFTGPPSLNLIVCFILIAIDCRTMARSQTSFAYAHE
jgi:O-antigen ligase